MPNTARACWGGGCQGLPRAGDIGGSLGGLRAGPGSQSYPITPSKSRQLVTLGQPQAPPCGWGHAKARLGRGPVAGPVRPGAMARQKRAMGSWSLALMESHWGRGWWPWGWCGGLGLAGLGSSTEDRQGQTGPLVPSGH